jgi:hypothetical protein
VEALYAKHALGSGLLSRDVTGDDVHVIAESQRQQAHLAVSLAGLRDAAASVEASRKEHRAALVRVNMGLIDHIKRLRECVAAAQRVVRDWPLEHGGSRSSVVAAAGAAAAATRRRRSSTGMLPSLTGAGAGAGTDGDDDVDGAPEAVAVQQTLRAVRLGLSPVRLQVPAAAATGTATQRVGARVPQLAKGTTTRRRASTGDVPLPVRADGASPQPSSSPTASQPPAVTHASGFVDVKPLQKAALGSAAATAVTTAVTAGLPPAAAAGAAAPSPARGRLAKGTTVQRARGSGPPPLVEQG